MAAVLPVATYTASGLKRVLKMFKQSSIDQPLEHAKMKLQFSVLNSQKVWLQSVMIWYNFKGSLWSYLPRFSRSSQKFYLHYNPRFHSSNEICIKISIIWVFQFRDFHQSRQKSQQKATFYIYLNVQYTTDTAKAWHIPLALWVISVAVNRCDQGH